MQATPMPHRHTIFLPYLSARGGKSKEENTTAMKKRLPKRPKWYFGEQAISYSDTQLVRLRLLSVSTLYSTSFDG